MGLLILAVTRQEFARGLMAVYSAVILVGVLWVIASLVQPWWLRRSQQRLERRKDS